MRDKNVVNKNILNDYHRLLQVQTVQRNIPANSQRKSVTTYGVPGSWDGIQTLRPSFPVELKDVLLLSVSPSGGLPIEV